MSSVSSIKLSFLKIMSNNHIESLIQCYSPKLYPGPLPRLWSLITLLLLSRKVLCVIGFERLPNFFIIVTEEQLTETIMFIALLLLSSIIHIMCFTTGRHKRSMYMKMSLSEDFRSQLKERVSSFKSGAWFPVGPTSGFDDKLPFDIVIADNKLVVWKNPLETDQNTLGWSVMRDVCPHRLAPLSQGRVDTHTGCIECPYHGWQFNSTGSCTKIPQLEPEKQNPTTLKKGDISSLPVFVLADMLWTFVPLPEGGPASYYPTLPDEVMPEVSQKPIQTLIRDLPYSFDFLVENLMDIAHAPFAHHALQSLRSDGQPFDMEQLTEKNNMTHLSLSFSDLVRGKVRDGTVNFQPPCYYTLRARGTIGIHCIPVSAGKSRVIAHLHFKLPPNLFTTLLTMIVFQPWLAHSRTNRFFESDMWVHDQEVVARQQLLSNADITSTPSTTSTSVDTSEMTTILAHNANDSDSDDEIRDSYISENTDLLNYYEDEMTITKSSKVKKLRPVVPKYVLPSNIADRGIIAWRNWWIRSGMSKSPIFGPAYDVKPIPILQQSDRYEAHVKYCKDCRNMLQLMTKVKKWAIFSALLPIILTRNWIVRVLGVVLYGALEIISTNIINSISGAVRGEKLSAAQFAPK